MKSLLLKGLLIWYVTFSIVMAISPADRQNWVLANVLPFLFVGALVLTYRRLPLSGLSYVLITGFLTLHTVGVHYTYAQAPFGEWLEGMLHLQRNHFDRIVHFCFGFLLTYPIQELFAGLARIPSWLSYYLALMTPLGLGGLWEIIESWVARIVSPELGATYLGSQGDVWDAQKDMAATLYGALLCMVLMVGLRTVFRKRAASIQEETMFEPSSCV